MLRKIASSDDEVLDRLNTIVSMPHLRKFIMRILESSIFQILIFDAVAKYSPPYLLYDIIQPCEPILAKGGTEGIFKLVVEMLRDSYLAATKEEESSGIIDG